MFTNGVLVYLLRPQFVFLLWSLQPFLSHRLQWSPCPLLPPGLVIHWALHTDGFSKQTKQYLLQQGHFASRFYWTTSCIKTEIQSHTHCHVPIIFLLIIAFSILLHV